VVHHGWGAGGDPALAGGIGVKAGPCIRSATIEAIIAGIEEGLLVEDVLGIGQGNIIGGDFSNNLSLAFKIEGGQIVGRVKDVSIAGNVYQDLRHVAALSRETAWVQSGPLAPYVLLPELNVVTKAG